MNLFSLMKKVKNKFLITTIIKGKKEQKLKNMNF